MEKKTMIREGEKFWRPIEFPELTGFSDFFPEVEETTGQWPHVYRPLLELESWEAGTWSDRGRTSRFQVSSFLSLSTQKKRRTMEVLRLEGFLEEFIRQKVLHISNGSVSFEVIEWDDGRALVTLQYGQIIGSHWLGVIDAKTIPVKQEVK